MGLPVMKTAAPAVKKEKKTYFRKHVDLYSVLQKIKLWPSRNGTLHGIKTLEMKGSYIELTTHCGHKLRIKNSKTSRVSRWLRNKWYAQACKECKIPDWKLGKFSSTSFR